MINRNSIERRFKVTTSDPLGRGWEVVLSVSLMIGYVLHFVSVCVIFNKYFTI